MSMYNMLHGRNPLAAVLLGTLGIDTGGKYTSGRYRDAHLSGDGTRIILLTRNGGGNRPDYKDVFKSLRKHPQYIRDYDDDFDSTYAYIEFKVPEWHLERLKAYATGKEPPTVREQFDKTMADLKNMSAADLECDPRTASLVAQLKEVINEANGRETRRSK